jgi:Tfp pilus assembly PilM family ATPase
MGKVHNMLGLAFEDTRIIVAEVRMRANRPHLLKSGEFVYRDGQSLENPTEFGQELHRFLKANNFSAKTAIVGLPAKWLIAKEVTIPPTSENALGHILGIQAERAFALNVKDLVFDYYGQADPTSTSTLLLMGTQRRLINQISTLAKVAGLKILAISPTAHALRHVNSDGDSDLSIYLRDDYAELWSAKAKLAWIKHSPGSAQQTQEQWGKALKAEIERHLLLTADNGQGSEQHRVTVYVNASLADEAIEKLSRSLSAHVKIVNSHAHLLSAGFDEEDLAKAGVNVAAAVLALTGIDNQRPFVDFLHSRMVTKKTHARNRIVIWAVVACVILVAGLLATVRQWQQDRRDIAAYTQQLEAMAEDIEASKQVVERMSYTTAWTSHKPVFLECLHQLTQAFPVEGTVWATSLAIRENKQGLISGKSLGEDSVLKVLDSIKQIKAFENVQMLYMRDAGRDTDEVSFAITFSFIESR